MSSVGATRHEGVSFVRASEWRRKCGPRDDEHMRQRAQCKLAPAAAAAAAAAAAVSAQMLVVVVAAALSHSASASCDSLLLGAFPLACLLAASFDSDATNVATRALTTPSNYLSDERQQQQQQLSLAPRF